LTFLQQHDCNKQSVVIAVGGGILQDIVAFAAHVYYRGLKWHFVPTTLLSMADSCIGAKSSINFNGFKNQLGSFHSPARVYIVDQFVRTLSDDEVRSGYGEIFKLFLIGSRDLFGRLKEAVAQDGFRNPSLPEFIYESLRVKQAIIEVDEYETGPRRILNYGHTFGHALEGLTHYEVPHGLAVVWGLDLVNWLAHRAGLLSREDFDDIHEFAARYFRPPPFTPRHRHRVDPGHAPEQKGRRRQNQSRASSSDPAHSRSSRPLMMPPRDGGF